MSVCAGHLASRFGELPGSAEWAADVSVIRVFSEDQKQFCDMQLEAVWLCRRMHNCTSDSSNNRSNKNNNHDNNGQSPKNHRNANNNYGNGTKY